MTFGVRDDTDATGPTTDLDRLYLTWGYREQRRSTFNEKFHTYGFEWNQNYMWTCESLAPRSLSMSLLIQSSGTSSLTLQISIRESIKSSRSDSTRNHSGNAATSLPHTQTEPQATSSDSPTPGSTLATMSLHSTRNSTSI